MYIGSFGPTASVPASAFGVYPDVELMAESPELDPVDSSSS